VRHRREYETHCDMLAERLTGHGGLALIFGGPGYPRAWEQLPGAPPPVVFVLAIRICWSYRRRGAELAQPRRATPSSPRGRLSRLRRGTGSPWSAAPMKLGHRIAAASARAAQAPRVIVLDRGLFAALGDETERDIFGLMSGHLRLDRTPPWCSRRFG